jgi:importin subunit beta-1
MIILQTLGSPVARAGGVAAQAVSAIAAIELPTNMWPELIGSMLGFVNDQNNTLLRISTLQAFGYVCEVIVSGRASHEICSNGSAT